jgi:hypothetical protein
VGFAAVSVCVASQRVFVVVFVVFYFVIGSVRKLLDTPSYLEVTDRKIVTFPII